MRLHLAALNIFAHRLMPMLHEASALTELDLSHVKIGDDGCKDLASLPLLGAGPQSSFLHTLKLCDNQIGEAGMQVTQCLSLTVPL